MSLPDLPSDDASSRQPVLSPLSYQNYGGNDIATREMAHQRNYVFVDEHNRHKRLKVMRACEGCRRRKIKCDAATTNSWPCAACTRLKLTCVPPTVNYEKDPNQPDLYPFEVQQTQDFPTVPVTTIGDYQRPQQMYEMPMQSAHTLAPPLAQPDMLSQTYEPVASYTSPQSYVSPNLTTDALRFGMMPASTMENEEPQYSGVFPGPTVSLPGPEPFDDTSWKTPAVASNRANSLDSSWNRPNTGPGAIGQSLMNDSWKSDSGLSPSADSLAEAMGGLKVDHVAVASYIADRNKLANTPALAEYEPEIPQSSAAHQRLQIPPEMMPSDEQAKQYFQYYFHYIHPYVPVLHSRSFYHQWHSNRDSISPLLLEAIFACTTMTLEDYDQGNKWLALASRHEDGFKDVPRLSTLQASLILLKAREAAPKRGYFYRSWMAIVNMVATSKDLEIVQHREEHSLKGSCNSDTYDCVAKTRIWQLLYILEAMIGGPQGRTEFNVDVETVDFNRPVRVPGIDETEFQVSYQFVELAKLVKAIRGTILIYGRLKKTKEDWSLDPEFVGHDEAYSRWLTELPQSLHIYFPADGSPPQLPNSFIANMLCYYYLSIIMHHRPQIHYLSATDKNWRRHMILCHDAAKKLCRIQEAILQKFGMSGMACMQRGISFPVYCVLTCTMLHLASITSPDPELNCEARDFFIRHMRILEQCIPHWPLPEVQAQVNSLREAFSADITKPFDLEPSFPYGSPSPSSPQAIVDGGYNQPHNPSSAPLRGNTHDASIPFIADARVGYTSPTSTQQPITPPISTTDEVLQADSPIVQGIPLMEAQEQAAGRIQGEDGHHTVPQWNPTKIFDQWNAAFGTPTSSTASAPSPPLQLSQLGTFDSQSSPTNLSRQYTSSPHLSYSSQDIKMQMQPLQGPQQVTFQAHPNNLVTPNMWQQVVANSLADGRKRVWDYSNGMGMDDMVKRQR